MMTEFSTITPPPRNTPKKALGDPKTGQFSNKVVVWDLQKVFFGFPDPKNGGWGHIFGP